MKKLFPVFAILLIAFGVFYTGATARYVAKVDAEYIGVAEGTPGPTFNSAVLINNQSVSKITVNSAMTTDASFWVILDTATPAVTPSTSTAFRFTKTADVGSEVLYEGPIYGGGIGKDYYSALTKSTASSLYIKVLPIDAIDADFDVIVDTMY